MFRIFLAAIISLISTQASAFQKFEEYRITANEIRSVKMLPQGVEEPATMVLKIGFEGRDEEEIVIESDQSLDSCKQSIEQAIGDETAYVQIITHTNAQTLNGIWVIGCSVTYGLIQNPE